MDPFYFKTAQAADYLQLSSRYLEALRCTGGGPSFIAFGKAIRYRKEDLDKWAASLKRLNTSGGIESPVP